MSEDHSSESAVTGKPAKPYPDFPLFPHATGRWAKKIKGKTHYFGRWDDPQEALRQYQALVAGQPVEKPRRIQHDQNRPQKPYPDFPLFPHAAKQWAKKIRGKLHYFGPWADPDAALAKFLKEKDALHAGRKPREDQEALTVKDVANAFLNAKQALVDAGELSMRTWVEYKAMADELVAHVGKMRLVADLDPEDFASLRNKLARKWGPHRLKKAIQYVRSVFRHAYESGLIDRPIRFGPGFNRPSAKVLRLHRAAQGLKMFTPEEIHQMLGAANEQLRAMILLGVNCGFGNNDCGTLPLTALDLDRGWANHSRPKTGIPRRAKLWPETVEALKEALANRPAPKDLADAGKVFITKYGHAWGQQGPDAAITHEMRKLLDKLGIDGHRNFYCLRHTFETIGGETRDQVAVDSIMGHADSSMAGVYRERIGDQRLECVANAVRTWLFGDRQELKE